MRGARRVQTVLGIVLVALGSGCAAPPDGSEAVLHLPIVPGTELLYVAHAEPDLQGEREGVVRIEHDEERNALILTDGASHQILDVDARRANERFGEATYTSIDYLRPPLGHFGDPRDVMTFSFARPWAPFPSTYEQVIGAFTYELTGQLLDDEVVIEGTLEGEPLFRIRLGFEGDVRGIHSLAQMHWADLRSGGNRTYEVTNVTVPDAAPIDLPPDSAPLETLPAHTFDELLEGEGELGLRLPLRDAWDAILRDPRVVSLESPPERLLTAKYDAWDDQPVADWRIVTADAEGETWVFSVRMAADPAARVVYEADSFAYGGVVASSYASWSHALQLVQHLAGTTNGSVERLHVLPPEYPDLHRGYVPLELLLEYVSDDGAHDFVRCRFDAVAGTPISCLMGPERPTAVT